MFMRNAKKAFLYSAYTILLCVLLLPIQARSQQNPVGVFLPMVSKVPTPDLAVLVGRTGQKLPGNWHIDTIVVGEPARVGQTLSFACNDFIWAPHHPRIACHLFESLGQEARFAGVRAGDFSGQESAIDGFYGFPEWSPDGTTMLLTGQTLELLYMDGSHTTLLPRVVSPGAAIWSPSGRAVMYPNEPQGLAIHPLTGELPFTIPASSFFAYAWSSDEKYIAFGEDTTKQRLVIVDPNTRTRTRTIDDVYFFRWSPDGSQLAFLRGPLGAQHVYLVAPTGSSERDMGIGVDFSWSPDGKYILVQEKVDSWDCQLINLVDNTQTSIYIPGFNLSWSPDSRTLAYISDNTTLFLTDIVTKTTSKIEMSEAIRGIHWSHDSEKVAVVGPAIFGEIRTRLYIIRRADGFVQKYTYPAGIIGYQWLT